MWRPTIHVPTVRRHAIVAVVTFVLDGFAWGIPLLVRIVGVIGCICGLALIVSGLFARRERILTGLLVVLTYFGVFLLVGYVCFGLHNEGARFRARPVIRALDAYRADHGAYPSDLEELTPAYLPRIPRAKDTLWLD